MMVLRWTVPAIAAFVACDIAVAAWLLHRAAASPPPSPPVTRNSTEERAPGPAQGKSTDEDEADAFQRLGPPPPGAWRERFPGESPLSFEDYVASEPVRADGERRALAFLPVGDFGPAEREALETAAEFAGLWFDLPVSVLPAVPLTEDEDQFRLRGDLVRPARQYRTRWFLNGLLPDRVPRDAVVLLGVTMADLYPGADWNFVFGEADLRRRVGVYSLARYFPEFHGDASTPETGRLVLLRTLKVVVHELGHTFGLEHCVTWSCAMNGSNSLAETDRAPLRLCPDCLRKLAWNRRFDIRDRYRRVAEFLAARGLAEDAQWHRSRAARGR